VEVFHGKCPENIKLFFYRNDPKKNQQIQKILPMKNDVIIGVKKQKHFDWGQLFDGKACVT
jgi:hypothetical protein